MSLSFLRSAWIFAGRILREFWLTFIFYVLGVLDTWYFPSNYVVLISIVSLSLAAVEVRVAHRPKNLWSQKVLKNQTTTLEVTMMKKKTTRALVSILLMGVMMVVAHRYCMFFVKRLRIALYARERVPNILHQR